VRVFGSHFGGWCEGGWGWALLGGGKLVGGAVARYWVLGGWGFFFGCGGFVQGLGGFWWGGGGVCGGGSFWGWVGVFLLGGGSGGGGGVGFFFFFWGGCGFGVGLFKIGFGSCFFLEGDSVQATFSSRRSPDGIGLSVFWYILFFQTFFDSKEFFFLGDLMTPRNDWNFLSGLRKV